jgi:hypothetical protein
VAGVGRIELDRIASESGFGVGQAEPMASAAGAQAGAFEKTPERGRKRREVNRARASSADSQGEPVAEESASKIPGDDSEAEGDAAAEENADENSERSVHRIDHLS